MPDVEGMCNRVFAMYELQHTDEPLKLVCPAFGLLSGRSFSCLYVERKMPNRSSLPQN